MKAKTKYLLTFVGFMMIVVMAIGITYGVLAARQIETNAPINVSYVAYNIQADVSAKYQVGNQRAIDLTTADDATVISFTGEEADEAELSFNGTGDIMLDAADNSTLMFFFTFHNRGGVPLAAKLQVSLPKGDNGDETYTTKETNLICSVSEDKYTWTEIATKKETDADPDTEATFYVEGGDTLTFCVRFDIRDKSKHVGAVTTVGTEGVREVMEGVKFAFHWILGY